MPATYTPPPLQRGRRSFTPDPKALDEFAKLLRDPKNPWVIADETATTRDEAYKFSTVYRKDLEARADVPEAIQARHFATDAEGTPIPHADPKGGEGIVWRFCLAYKTVTG